MAWFRWFRRKDNGKGLGGVGTATARAGGERYEMVGERRHLADAPYVLPSDDQEINRLDFQHFMLRYTLRGNYAAPIQQPHSILDVGAGTGRWAMEMASLFPNANVVGVDVTPPPADRANASLGAGLDIRPENYAFVQGNILEGLPFADQSFDYVHQRLLLFAIPETAWPKVVAELARVTRVGGWIELVETGPQQHGGPAMDRIVDWITATSNRRGVNPLLGPQIGNFLRDARLGSVEARAITLPVGSYGGRVGKLAETDVFGVVGGVKALVVSQNLTTAEAYDDAMRVAREDLDRYRCYLPFYLAYGQRVS
ncbi:MAG TPA: methyltransferase domain-containing protein [Ktedonobacterales bacterium]|nr:methyltransferase domain-containing protein [Ktedonobacterales bacterium]